MNNRHIFWLLFGLGTTLAAGYATFALAHAPPHSSHNVTPASDRSAVSPNVAVSPPAVSRPGLNSYQRAIPESLFTAPQPKTHAPAPQKPAPPVVPAAPVVPPADPLADAVYSGSVTMDGKTTALIESRSTKQGTYVEEGETWQGFQILSVSQSEVTLSVNGTVRTLAKSEAMNLVPLSGNAPGAGAGGGNRGVGPGAGGAESQMANMAVQQMSFTQESAQQAELQSIMESRLLLIQDTQSLENSTLLLDKR